MKKTKHDKLYKRRLKTPPKFLYSLIYHLGKSIFKKYNMQFTFKDDPKKEISNFVILANHANRNDFLFSAIPCYPKRLNFVAAYNEFFRSNLALLFKVMQLIPKRQFMNDSYTAFEIIRLVKKEKANICFYPEGLSTISGANQPVAPGTGKLLKFLKVPIYIAKTSGAYLLYPKYCDFLKGKERYAKVETIIEKILTVEDLEKLTNEEIEYIINKKLFNDDYEWAINNNIVYKDNHYPIAKDLNNILYKCPKCNNEFSIVTKSNRIYCTHCGNEAIIDDSYHLHPLGQHPSIPKTQSKWWNYQRIKIKEEISNNPDFVYEVETSIGTFPPYKNLPKNITSIKVGEGKLILSLKDGFSYIGTKNNSPYTIHFSNQELYTFCMSYDATRLHFYNDGGTVTEFRFKTPGEASKVLLVQQELHRACGGVWQGFKEEYDINNIF